MASLMTTGVSRRTGLAIATAVTGLVLAAGVSVAGLVGWVRPAQAVTDTVPASAPAPSSMTAPQVVLVPVAPVTTPAQPPATSASLAGAMTSDGPSTASGALVASRHTERDRSEGARLPHGERDDD
jgi:hypothetical protein